MESNDSSKTRDRVRIDRERATVEAMIILYCKGHSHDGPSKTFGRAALCSDCAHLLDYAERKLDSCPQADNKPTCLKCSIHCYDGDHRESIRNVMKFAGPRMLLRHPIMAVRHMLDGRRK